MAWRDDPRSSRFDEQNGRSRSPLRFSELTDPDTVSARVFVGSLTPDITKNDLEDHFSRWGNIVGVTMNKNKFGFVQFGNEREAQSCLTGRSTTNIRETVLDLKPAKIGHVSSAPPAPPGYDGSPSERSPLSGKNMSWGDSSRDEYRSSRTRPSSQDNYYESYYRDVPKERDPESSYYDSYYRDYYNNSRSSGGREASSSNDYYRTDADRYSSSRSMDITSSCQSSLEALDPLDPARPNDLEIVVPNKQQRPFAERIEARLKNFNILVDLLFPPADISYSRVVSDLTARRCRYVVLATPENEKHNSITVNILHGDPQEHRNMPVDDALNLIRRNFEDYVRQTRMRNTRQVVPRDIRNLLLDLLEMRSLSMGDLDKLIKYLRQRQNVLVDDQIELKRETSGTQTSVVAAAAASVSSMGSMTVAYPGYNYLATTAVPAAVSGTSHANVTQTHQAIVPSVVVSSEVTPASIVSSHNSDSAAAAAAMAAYSASYNAIPQTGMVGAYGVTAQVVSHSQQPHTMIQATAPVVTAQEPAKESGLQAKILTLMKNQGITLPGAVPPPPPTAVPPPSVGQTSTYMTVQQQMWVPQQQGTADDSENMAQTNAASYNPWGQ